MRKMLLRLLLIGFFSILSGMAAHADPVGAHFVFVGGYRSEKIPGYFEENARLLRAAGARVSIILPKSESPVLENAERVRRELLRLGGPLTIVAHSKGGLEVFHALVRNAAAFPPEVVERAYLVQSPLEGSVLADIVDGYDKLNAFNPFWKSQDEGARSMRTHDVNRDLRASESMLDPREAESLSSRIFYIRSKQIVSKVSKALTLAATQLAPFGENDGAVLTRAQKIDTFAGRENFGTDLGVIAGRDHMDLLVAGRDASLERLGSVRGFTDYLTSKSPLACRALFVR